MALAAAPITLREHGRRDALLSMPVVRVDHEDAPEHRDPEQRTGLAAVSHDANLALGVGSRRAIAAYVAANDLAAVFGFRFSNGFAVDEALEHEFGDTMEAVRN